MLWDKLGEINELSIEDLENFKICWQ